MKKIILILAITLSSIVSVAQTKKDTIAKKSSIEYSYLWGLFKSDNYVGRKNKVSKIERIKVKSVKISKIDTTKYEEKSMLWGALKWTEKKEKNSNLKTKNDEQ